MKDQHISLETAQLAKEQGFNWEVRFIFVEPEEYEKAECSCPNNYYVDDKDYPAPTQSLLQKWLREEHDLYIEICVQDYVESPEFYFNIFGRHGNLKTIVCVENGDNRHATYEEALEEALQKALTLIKEKE